MTDDCWISFIIFIFIFFYILFNYSHPLIDLLIRIYCFIYYIVIINIKLIIIFSSWNFLVPYIFPPILPSTYVPLSYHSYSFVYEFLLLEVRCSSTPLAAVLAPSPFLDLI